MNNLGINRIIVESLNKDEIEIEEKILNKSNIFKLRIRYKLWERLFDFDHKNYKIKIIFDLKNDFLQLIELNAEDIVTEARIRNIVNEFRLPARRMGDMRY